MSDILHRSPRRRLRANATIANAADAEETRNNCRVIQGSLSFDAFLSESINLDGIEVVEGSIQYLGCDLSYEKKDNRTCLLPELFTILSPTLTTVTGNLGFDHSTGLEKIVLPNLRTVNGSLSFRSLKNISHIDITALEHVNFVSLDTRNLKTLLLDGQQAFTGKYTGVSIWHGGSVESFDGFFKNPLSSPESDTATPPIISIERIPSVRKLTIG